jgi:hypothetical protein
MERPDRYSPLFSVDTRNGDILWALWIEGFEKAVALRPPVWTKRNPPVRAAFRAATLPAIVC